jgi:hypothetical protein
MFREEQTCAAFSEREYPHNIASILCNLASFYLIQHLNKSRRRPPSWRGTEDRPLLPQVAALAGRIGGELTYLERREGVKS